MEYKKFSYKFSFEKQEFLGDLDMPNPTQRSVMPIIMKEGEKLIPLGTAFCINEYGIMLTAVALGYSKMTAEYNLTSNSIGYNQSLNATRGMIEEVHNQRRDNIMLNFPCFRTNSRYDSGMSGGPIFEANGSVIGLISSSFTGETDDNLYTSYGVLLAPAFTLKALVKMDSEAESKEYSLYELTKLGLISVDETFSNINYYGDKLTYR